MSAITGQQQSVMPINGRVSQLLQCGLWSIDCASLAFDCGPDADLVFGFDPKNRPEHLSDWLAFIADEEPGRANLKRIIELALQQPQEWQLECRVDTGSVSGRWIRLHGWPRLDAESRMIAINGLVRDLTVEKSVLDHATRVAGELDNLNYALNQHSIVSIGDLSGRILYANDKFVQISGYSREELLGSNHNVVSSGTHDESFWQNFWGSLNKGSNFVGEICNRKKNGELYWVETTVVPHLLRSGEIDKYIAIRTDVTEKKRQEKERQSAAKTIQKLQQLDALGRCVGGVAHDFNNILAVILGYGRLVFDGIEQSGAEDHKLYLNNIVDAAERAQQLVKDMLAFAKGVGGEREYFDPGLRLEQVLPILESMVGDDIAIELRLCDVGLSVLFIQSGFDQLLMNLCVNARDAMNATGTITISCERVFVAANICSSCGCVFSGEFVCIRVEDTGPGVPDNDFSQLFEPFFTTKENQKVAGTGMGLSVVHGVLHQEDSHIVMQNLPYSGLEAAVYIPSSHTPDQRVCLPSDNHTDVDLADRLIVVVDDAPEITSLLELLLEPYDANVICYHSGLDLLKNRVLCQSADHLLINLTMPMMTGMQLLHALRDMGCTAQIIAMTGHSEQVTASNHESHGFDGYLDKPIDRNQLLQLLNGADQT